MVQKIKEELKKRWVIQGLIGYALIFLLILGSLGVYVINAQNQNYLQRENQGYIRYLTCVADIRNSEKVITISDEISEACWKVAEQRVGIPLQRYDKSITD